MVDISAIMYSLAGSLSLASRNVLARKGLIGAHPVTGVFIALLVAVPVTALFAVANGDFLRPYNLDPLSLLYLALAGILHFLVARSFTYSSIKIMGPSRVSPIIEGNIIISSALAVILLGETMTPALGIGTILVVLGVVAISRSETKESAGISKQQIIRGASRALLASAIWGVTPLIIKLGVTRVESAIIATLISVFFGLVASLPVLVHIKGRTIIAGIDKRVLTILLISGVFQSTAQIFRFLAFSVAPVVIVSPISNATSIFTLVMGHIFIPKLEKINRMVVLAVLLVVVGVVLVASTS